MVRRQLVSLIMVVLLVVTYTLSPVFAITDTLESEDYVGPGKYETYLYINTGQQKGVTDAGKVAMWNTKDKFLVNIETREEWQIDEVSIYVGSDPVPTSEGGAPKLMLFPYRKSFTNPVSSYELTLDLVNDLDFTWGKRDKGKSIQNVAVYVKLVGKGEYGKQGIHQQAWAYGENEFQSERGWWTRYALSHPKRGQFIDAPVDGLGYKTSTHKGRTNSNGAFDYFEGETVTLSIGSLNLGTVSAKHKVSPLDMVGTDELDDPRVINMARILQSLDVDSDPTRGIAITEPIVNSLDEAMQELNITTLDLADSELVDSLIESTVKKGNKIEGVELRAVSSEEARSNLEEGLSSNIFRKNVSKDEAMEVAKAKLELMPVYVPALKSNDDPVELEYTYADGTSDTRNVAKPLVVVYASEVADTDGAMDVYAAISRDEGNTWKRKNLSRSADKSSFTLANGIEYPGEVKKPQVKVKDNKILVAWTSKYARSGKPTYAIRTDDDYIFDDPYYTDDIWGVSGPQKSVDYAELDFPEVGEIPFSCVWTCRGIIDPDTGEITWFKPERLTSGRRDAYQLMFNGAKNAGFAVTWQEDPEGLRPGEQAGPGEGWSGATTNHKTDIWYSYIVWDDFDDIDENFVSGGDSEQDEDEDEEMVGRPKALVPFSLPVRISDNDTLNSDNLKATKDENEEWIEEVDESGKFVGSHRYGYMVDGLCDSFYEKTNNQGVDKQVCVTEDGRLLDGDTGASRPNIMLQPYKKPDGTYSAWAIICYEETKGVGAGPPETVIESVYGEAETETVAESVYGDDGLESFDILGKTDTETVADSVYEDDSHNQSGKGTDGYSPDLGKNVIYHSFDLANPDLVSAGTILNPQATDTEGNLLYLVDENGSYLKDWKDELIPAYENARRPRLIIQSKTQALGNEDEGTTLVCLFKMGEEGKGRQSDIFMRRWVVKRTDQGNPYATKYLTQDIQNISSVTPIETRINLDSETDKESINVLSWEQTEGNLEDLSGLNPYDDARAHRGFIKGNFLAIAYDWTPNWAASRNGNDVYNLYIRRSFDGGANWTTDPDGTGVEHCDIFKLDDTKETKERKEVITSYDADTFEPARNVSQLRNTKESVIEPRLVGVPGTIKTDGVVVYPEDKQDPTGFWVTYGTESNPGRNDEEVGEPLDIYYSYSIDRGENYNTVDKTISVDSEGNYAGEVVQVWDWLAKDTGKKEAAQAECQIRMTPDASIFYAVWNENGEDGSDVMFRRIMRDDGGDIQYVTSISDTDGPEITISGVSDGDITSSDVSINISLNETGTWTGDLDKDGVDFREFGATDIPYSISADADNSAHTYTLKVDAQDSFGNSSVKEIQFTIDNRLPRITVEGVTDGEITNNDKTISVSATGDDTTISLTRDGESVDFISGDTLSQEGAYSLDVSSTDSPNNLKATKTIDFIIDKAAPDITITGIIDGETYSKTVKPVISVKDNYSTEQNIKVLTQLNGETFVSGTTVKDKGTYTLTVSATDEADNENTVTYIFTIKSASTNDNSSSSSKSKKATESEEEPKVLEGNIEYSKTTEINTEDGKLKVTVPAFATTENSVITITPVEEGFESGSGIVRIGDMIYQIEVKDDSGNNITQFNKDLVLEFSYSDEDIPQGTKEEDIKICYWDEEAQNWITIPTEVDTSRNLITAVTNHLTIYAVMAVSDFPALTDVKGHWAEKDVYKIVSMKIASGDPSGSFRPEDKISREEFAILVVSAAGLQPEKNPMLTFDDTDEIANWAKGYVSAAVKAGIIRGYEDNTFKPKRNVARAEIAIMIVKALNKQLPKESHINFSDANDIPKWALPYIAKAVEEGIISGFPDGTFKSDSNATRAQSAVMISRMLDVK